MSRNKRSKKRRNKQAIERLPIIPSWIKAGLITGALLIVVTVANSVTSGMSAICYPIQLFAFLGNGLLAAYFEQDAFHIRKRLNPQTLAPNYLAIGVGAGFVVATIIAAVYLIIWSQLGSLFPPGLGLLVDSPLALIGIDSIAAIGLGMVGAFVGKNLF